MDTFRKIAVASLTLLALAGNVFAHGETETSDERSYEYSRIAFEFVVNKDTTINVREYQRYDFNGEYHQAVRYIPLDRVGAITDISVIDAATGVPLTYSSKRLEKADPRNWDMYTTYRENGNQYIEWYYGGVGEEHEWELRYTLHGALAFYGDHDELYWDLFNGFDVPVREVEAKVTLPENSYDTSTYQTQLYTKPGVAASNSYISDDKKFVFSVKEISPGDPVTIAPGWPKGIVDQSAYWRDFLSLYWGYLVSVLIFVGTVLYLIWYWYKTEINYPGKRTIVAEYEPPKKLKPAMMDIIVHERATSKTWPATVIDLAVRGHLRIAEDPHKIRSFLGKAWPVFLGLIIWIFFLSIFQFSLLINVIFLVVMGLSSGWFVRLKPASEYILTKVNGKSEDSLNAFEKEFLRIVFEDSDTFSTRNMKKVSNQSNARAMAKDMEELRKNLLEEVEMDTIAYLIPPKDRRMLALVWAVIAGWAFSYLIWIPGISYSQGAAILLTLLASLFVIVLFRRYNPRLNPEGNRLREACLGFKLYLETAEKYRMQNLTPELFEKFLPYAMIFGVEKKWAKAFEAVNIKQPGWYAGSAVYAAGVSGSGSNAGAPNFSATAFSASFSSSFSSAFSSSTGSGGASGGGGGAGGGGGGGGGGAS